MFKSIFAKYFAVTAAIITIAFVLMGGAQGIFARRYWIAEKEEMLTENAQNVAAFLSDNAFSADFNSYYLSGDLAPMMRYLASSVDGSVLVTDNKFRILLTSHEQLQGTLGSTLPATVQTKLQGGPFFALGRLDGIYTGNQYIAGVPLVPNGQTVGYVLVCSSAAALQEYIAENLRVYLLSGVAVLMLAFVVLYMLTYRMVRPLREMAAATRQFSRGDFSCRIHVRGQDEVAELATALNGMAASLSSVEEMRRSFVANVSHELKTPMTTISGFVDGILDGTVPEEKREYYLKIVSDEVKRLSRLVGAMLNLSRIDSGQLKLHPVTFDFTEVVCATLLSFEQRIDKKGIAIEGMEECEPHTVVGDYDLLTQVVYNLLDNAVKFTDPNGTIRLSVSEESGRTVCTVRNTGDGIPPAELPHIFERFYKSDRSRGLDKSGTGLGLYIVKSVINLHGGEITVRSVEQEYCEFSFWLPSVDLQKN